MAFKGTATEHLHYLDTGMAEVARGLKLFYAGMNEDRNCDVAFEQLGHTTRNVGVMNEHSYFLEPPWTRERDAVRLDPKVYRRYKKRIRALNMGVVRAEAQFRKRCLQGRPPVMPRGRRRASLLEF